jgi:hypothetical protein
MKPKTEYFPLMSLRETLRLDAAALTNRMARSVGRLTSCDLLPCEEYGEEVSYQRQLAQQVFYLQNCRAALERCIVAGATAVRYRWPDGTVTMTRFRMVTPSRVKVTGLQKTDAA